MVNKIKKQRYGWQDIAKVVSEFFVKNGMSVVYEDDKSETGFTKPSKLDSSTVSDLVEEIILSLQKALIDGKRVYFIEIGYIETVTKKKGTNVFNLSKKMLETLSKDKHRIKVRASDEIIRKLNLKK